MATNEKAERYVSEIKAACTSEEEFGCLTRLIRYLEVNGVGSAGSDGEKNREDDLEVKYLRAAASSNASRQYILAPCESVFSVEEDLRDFVAYVFLRRYGWSETIADETVYRMKHVGRASSNESELKAPMNSVLDEYLSWMNAQDISLAMLQAYISALDRASGHHIVRKLLVVHTMTWLARHFSEMDPVLFNRVKHLIMAGLSDCWSAVRSSCAGKLGRLLDRFKLEQLESFFMSVVAVCRDPGASWQAQEGAAMAIGIVIKRFHLASGSSAAPMTGACMTPVDPVLQNGSTHLLKFGKDQLLMHLPGFISSNIFDVTFWLLRHEQLSIREFGTKALSSYLMCCDFEEAIRTLDDVVIQLRRGCGMLDRSSEQSMAGAAATNGVGAATPAGLWCCGTRNAGVWMDAYAAEGLLGVCVFLVKHIPSNLLLPCWQMYFSTFSLLLMHPASTVRQAVSTVFKFIVSRGASNPMVLWLVLHGLSHDILHVISDSLNVITQSTTGHRSVTMNDGGHCLPKMTTMHQEANHCRDIADSIHSCSGETVGLTRASSDVEINNNGNAVVATVAASNLMMTRAQQQQQQLKLEWELLEGRLLTYELVLRFLNKNHWLYVFDVHEAHAAVPTAATMPAPCRRPSVLMASASGADIRARQMMPHPRLHVNKVHTYAGATFKASMDIGDARGDPTLMPGRQLLRSMYSRRPSQSTSVGYLASEQSMHVSHHDSRAVEAPVTAGAVGVGARLQSSSDRGGLSLAACSLLQAAKVLHHGSKGGKTGSVLGQERLGVPKTATGQAAIAADSMASSCSQLPTGSIEQASAEPTSHQLLQQELLHDKEATTTETSVLVDGEALTEQCPFTSTFETMFLQTVDCIASEKWELQRIGGQVLPCLTETIGWYNVDLLKKLWVEHLTADAKLVNDSSGRGVCGATDGVALCYGACLSLLYMLRYAIKLGQLLDPDKAPGLQHEDHKRRDEVRRITDFVTAQLPRLLPRVAAIMNRPTVDRMSSVALQIVALAVSSFDHLRLENTEQFISSITSLMGDIASMVHPELSITTSVSLASVGKTRCRSLTSGGYLSFCSHETIKDGITGSTSASRHLLECSERHLFADAAPCLLALVRKFHTSTHSIWNMLPILAYHACTTADDLLRKMLAEGITVLLSGMAASCQHSSATQGRQLADDIRSACVAVLCQQVKSMRAEALGNHRLRSAMDLLSSVCLSPDGSGCKHLAATIGCLCDQWQSNLHNEGGSQSRSATRSTPQPVKPKSTTKDLEILSNDIHGLASSSSASEPTDDEDIADDGSDDAEPASFKHDAIFSEADLVSPWHGSHGEPPMPLVIEYVGVNQNRDDHDGSNAGVSQKDGLCRLPSGSDDSGSAWDSWDDSDEEPDSENLFSDYLAKVITGLVQLSRRAEIEQELARLPSRERALVRAALGAQTTHLTLQF